MTKLERIKMQIYMFCGVPKSKLHEKEINETSGLIELMKYESRIR